jgi:hypothetical protein
MSRSVSTPSWPRALRLAHAAEYLDMGKTKFLEMLMTGDCRARSQSTVLGFGIVLTLTTHSSS